MKKKGVYEKFIKRPLDFTLSCCGITLLSPAFVVLTATGAVAMKGNPFFTQKRPGLNEKVFNIIKYRTMTNEKDSDGKLLPDEERLNRYGKFLRTTSLDEIPELFNILKGDMAIVGPRPLLVKYLPLYNEEQRQRHSVRPGLTGLAQVRGRNCLSWKEKFKLDVEYVNNISFKNDVKIILETIETVVKKEGISSDTSATMEAFTGNE